MAESMAVQADQERAAREGRERDEALKAQQDRDSKTEEYMGADVFVVVAQLVQLKVKDASGGFVVKQFNEGAVVKADDLDAGNLRHHVDMRYMVPKGASEAQFAGPAGTPKPGEPPNVPVEEGTPPENLPLEQRLARQQAAVDKAEQSEQQSAAARARAAKSAPAKSGSDKTGS